MNKEIDLHLNEKSKTQREDVIKRHTKEKKVLSKHLNTNNYGTTFIPEFKGTRLTLNNIYKMPIDEREEVAKFLFDYFRKGGFPYPKFTNEELQEDWEKLKELEINDPTVVQDKYLTTNNQKGILLFKHFLECFWEVKDDGKRSKSMKEAFDNDEMLMKVIRNRLGITFIYRGENFNFDIHGNMLRQGFRSTRLGCQISTFRVAVAKFIYEKYTQKNDIVYDLSMGFGQRLLGALSSKNNLTYISTDPWEKVINEVSQMTQYIETIDPNIQNRYQINKMGAEDFCPKELQNKVSLVFSSPPYFNKEVYSNDNSQCYNHSYDYFINTWWNKVINNCSKLLKENGIFAFNMSEKHKKFNLLEDMIKICNRQGFKEIDRYFLHLSKSHLSGKVGTDNLKKFEPVVIMQKL